MVPEVADFDKDFNATSASVVLHSLHDPCGRQRHHQPGAVRYHRSPSIAVMVLLKGIYDLGTKSALATDEDFTALDRPWGANSVSE